MIFWNNSFFFPPSIILFHFFFLPPLRIPITCSFASGTECGKEKDRTTPISLSAFCLTKVLRVRKALKPEQRRIPLTPYENFPRVSRSRGHPYLTPWVPPLGRQQDLRERRELTIQWVHKGQENQRRPHPRYPYSKLSGWDLLFLKDKGDKNNGIGQV